MAMLGAQRKEKKLRLYREEMDILALLKMRAGDRESVIASKVRISCAKRVQLKAKSGFDPFGPRNFTDFKR
jgi:hypothetical protein